MRPAIAIALCLVLFGCTSQTRPPRLEPGTTSAGEQLLYPLPDGYTVVARKKEGKKEYVQIVPAGQTIDGCTDMIIAQVFRGGVDATPSAFAESIAARWKKACDSSYAEILESGTSNGYPFATWWMVCTRNDQTGKSEHTYAKAIAGKDGFYVVQKAWRTPPSSQQVEQWKKDFFRQVQLCDSRAPQEHGCPAEATVLVPK